MDPALTSLLATTATWLLTYALHSLAWCTLALLAGHAVLRRPSECEVMWKAALLLPLLTATGALLVGSSGAPVSLTSLLRAAGVEAGTRVEVTREVVRVNGEAPIVTDRIFDTAATTLNGGVLMLMLGLSGIGAVRYGRRQRAFAHTLRNRQPVTQGTLAPHEAAVLTVHGTPVRVTQTDTLQVPVALGTREVCLPAEVFARLSASQRAAVLAHEVAHLERADPRWLNGCAWLVALSPFQPLTRHVLMALRRDVELICDGAAAARTGNGRALAESLAVLARTFDPRAPQPLAAALNGSPLVQRVEYLLAGSLLPASSPARRAGLGVALLVLVALLVGPGPLVATTPAAPGAVERVVREVVLTSAPPSDAPP